MSLEQGNKCVDHPTQDIIFICLFSECGNTRLGCQKCLLSKHSKCIKACLFLNEINEEAFAWSGEINDKIIHQFIQNKVTGSKEIDQNLDDLVKLVLVLLKEAKKEVLKKRIKCKSEIQKSAKIHINQYSKSFSVEGLKDVVLDFHSEKITEQEATQQITLLSKQRANLEDQNRKGKIVTTLPSLHKDDMKSMEKELIFELSNIQNIVSFSQSWQFIKSTLSKHNHSAQGITEITSGSEFSFNDNDKWQLIYGTQRWKGGSHQWEVSVNLVDKISEDKQEEEKKTEDEVEGGLFESMMQTQNGFGSAPLANTGMFAGTEYTSLNRLYIGVVTDEKKDSNTNYVTNSAGCQGLDIIRGQLFGSMYMAGGSQQVQNSFKTKKQNGITFICVLDIDTKSFTIKEKDGLASYASNYHQQGNLNWRPFILSVKSKVIIKLHV